MVEITYQMVLSTIQTASLVVGIIYYLTIMRNSQRTQQQTLETRQATLFMNLYETLRSPTFRKQFDDVVFRIEYENWDDMVTILDPIENPDVRTSWFSVAQFFDGVGVLLKRELIDISFIDDLLATDLRYAWEKIGPIETESRKRFNQPRAFVDFEYLYNELMKYHEEHPELKT